MFRVSIASLQWFLFMISNSMIVPIVIASQFHLNAAGFYSIFTANVIYFGFIWALAGIYRA